MGEQFEIEPGTQDVLTDEPGGARFVQRLLEALVEFPDFAMDIVVAAIGAHREGGDRHAFDYRVRIELHDVAVLEGPRFAFVGVADHIFVAWKRAWHERPLQTRRKARSASTAKTGSLDLGNDLVGRHARAAIGAQDLLQRGITAAGHVILQTPVGAIQPGVDLRVDVAPMETGFSACGLEAREERQVTHLVHPCPFKVSTRSSSRSWLMKLSILRSFTSMTGASAQAPRHSLGCTVKAPSAVVP